MESCDLGLLLRNRLSGLRPRCLQAIKRGFLSVVFGSELTERGGSSVGSGTGPRQFICGTLRRTLKLFGRATGFFQFQCDLAERVQFVAFRPQFGNVIGNAAKRAGSLAGTLSGLVGIALNGLQGFRDALDGFARVVTGSDSDFDVFLCHAATALSSDRQYYPATIHALHCRPRQVF